MPRWARGADALAIALLLFAVWLVLYGRGVIHLGGVRISVRSVWRPVFWAGALFAVRHYFVRSEPLPQRIGRRFRAIMRAPEPQYPDVMFGSESLRLNRRGRAVSFGIGIVLVYAGLTLAMTYPQVSVLDRGVSIDMGDPLLSTWRLAWIAHQLPRDPLHLFDANIFHPELRTLAYSDAMLIPSLTVAPLVWLGMSPLLASNLLLLSGFALSGAAMFLLVWSLTRHIPAAFLAGFVFAFLPYRFMHYAHLELQMAQWTPLCLWALHRTVTSGRLRDGLLTGVFLALQTLSSWYYGIFLATYLVPIAVVLLAGSGRDSIRRSVRPLVAGVALAGVLVLPLAIPYFEARQTVGERPVEEIKFYSATPINYLAAHPRNALIGKYTAAWGGQERELFQGIVVPLIALIGLWPPLSRVRLGYAIAMVLAFEISLGFNGATFPRLHAYVLPYRGLRVPARMAMLVGMSLSVFVGYGVARLCARFRGRRAAGVALALLVTLVFVEYRSTLVLKDVWTTPPSIYERFRDRPNTVVLNLPIVAPDVALEPIYMYFSTFRWHQLLNGYSGFSPPWYQPLVERMSAFPDDSTMAELRQHGVDCIIVHGAFYDREKYDRLVARLDARDDLTLVDRTMWEGRESRVYSMLRQQRRE